MVTTPSSDLDSTIARLGLRGAERWGISWRLTDIARNSPTAYAAERSIQELLLKAGNHNPLTGAAKLIDGPLAHLVGLDYKESPA